MSKHDPRDRTSRRRKRQPEVMGEQHEELLQAAEPQPGPARERHAQRPQPSLAEQAALARAQLGDGEAFAVLVRRYGQPILSLCYASVLNSHEAEDLAQEVFLAAWRALPKFRNQSSFSTWLFALARNRCIDSARRRRVRPQPLTETDSAVTVTDFADETPRLMTRMVFVAAAELSLPLRQALLLRDVQGLSYEEIAALQDIPLGTVRSRIAAARTAVARGLSGG